MKDVAQGTATSPGADMMDAPNPYIITVTLFTTLFLILAIILILVRSRTLEMKLLLIGIFLAIAASVEANVVGVGANAAQVAISGALGSATLLKIAVILTLSGAGMMLLSRVAPPATPPIEREVPHVD